MTAPPATPVLATPPNATFTVGQTYTATASATDSQNVPLYYSLPGNTTGLTIDPVTGNMRWTATAADVGSHTITLEASDERGGVVTTSFTLTVLPATQPPVFTSGTPTIATAGDPYQFTATAVDPQGYPLTYSIVPVTGVTLTGSTFSFIPTTAQVGQNINITLTATDSPPAGIASASTSITYHIPVQATQPLDHAPYFGAQPRTLVEVGQPYAFDYDGSDPDSDPLTYTLTGSVPGLTFNTTAGTLTGTPSTVGSYALVAGISDGRGGTASLSYTLVVTAAAADPTPGAAADHQHAAGRWRRRRAVQLLRHRQRPAEQRLAMATGVRAARRGHRPEHRPPALHAAGRGAGPDAQHHYPRLRSVRRRRRTDHHPAGHRQPPAGLRLGAGRGDRESALDLRRPRRRRRRQPADVQPGRADLADRPARPAQRGRLDQSGHRRLDLDAADELDLRLQHPSQRRARGRDAASLRDATLDTGAVALDRGQPHHAAFGHDDIGHGRDGAELHRRRQQPDRRHRPDGPHRRATVVQRRQHL